MKKMISVLVLCLVSLSINAAQSKEEIIRYCNKTMLDIGGNYMVVRCIQMELDAQAKIAELSK